MSILGFTRDQQDVKNAILNLAEREKQVVYGQQSVNVQLPERFRRETKDYDILTKKPKISAERLVSKLNREFGSGEFHVEPAKYKKTFKVKDKLGKTVADYTLTTKKPESKVVLGVRYANLSYQEKKLKRILKDEASAFRHDRDLDVLNKIKEGRKRW